MKALNSAGEDLALQSFLPARMRKGTRDDVWYSFSQQQLLIVDGIRSLRTLANRHSVMNLLTKADSMNQRVVNVCNDYDAPKEYVRRIVVRLHNVEASQADVHRAFQRAYLATSREYPEVSFLDKLLLCNCLHSNNVRCKMFLGWQSATLL
jgi:hypothetical protein